MKYAQILMFGTGVTPLSFDDIYDLILLAIHKKRKLLLFALNIHSLRLIQTDAKVKKTFEKADIVFPDGVPLLWLSRLQNAPLKGRVSGTSLVEKILKTREVRVFLVGATLDTLKLLSVYCDNWRGARVVGMAAPTLRQNCRYQEIAPLLKRIVDAKPNIILVGLGQPKQEVWLNKYFHQLPVRVGLGVGSALDILSGKIPRSPAWMQSAGLEWLWRLGLEPHRLFLRYFTDGLLVISYVIKRYLHIIFDKE